MQVSINIDSPDEALEFLRANPQISITEKLQLEKIIATDPSASYKYAKLLNCAFPAGEPAIASNANWSLMYATDVLNRPFPAGEPAIATHSQASYEYAKEVLNGPFPAGEAAIAESAFNSVRYALLRLTGPFPAGEEAISKSGHYSYFYAMTVLNHRFLAGEAAIKAESSSFWELYSEKFIVTKTRFQRFKEWFVK